MLRVSQPIMPYVSMYISAEGFQKIIYGKDNGTNFYASDLALKVEDLLCIHTLAMDHTPLLPSLQNWLGPVAGSYGITGTCSGVC